MSSLHFATEDTEVTEKCQIKKRLVFLGVLENLGGVKNLMS